MRPSWIVGFLLSIAGCVGVAEAVDITACGVVLVRGETGVLQTDLVCDVDTVAVRLESTATLQMNGHTITNGNVVCTYKCTIVGLGEIINASLVAGTRLIATDIDIHDGGGAGIYVTAARGRTVLTHVTVRNHEYGIASGARGTVVLRNSLVTGNEENGMDCSRAQLTDSAVTDNGEIGINAGRVVLATSQVTGNNGFGNGVDLLTVHRPVLLPGSTCGLSSQVVAGNVQGPAWGVCTGD